MCFVVLSAIPSGRTMAGRNSSGIRSFRFKLYCNVQKDRKCKCVCPFKLHVQGRSRTQRTHASEAQARSASTQCVRVVDAGVIKVSCSTGQNLCMQEECQPPFLPLTKAARHSVVHLGFLCAMSWCLSVRPMVLLNLQNLGMSAAEMLPPSANKIKHGLLAVNSIMVATGTFDISL